MGLHKIEGVRNPLSTMTHKELFWKNSWTDFWRISFLVKLQARSLLFYKKWAQSKLFLKNFAWYFENMFFTEHIWIAASWKLPLFHRSTLRLWYTVGPDSITLDTKSVVKINYYVPTTSTTNLKKTKFDLKTRFLKTF